VLGLQPVEPVVPEARTQMQPHSAAVALQLLVRHAVNRLGCHWPRIDDVAVFDELVEALVVGPRYGRSPTFAPPLLSAGEPPCSVMSLQDFAPWRSADGQ
jgi:hypothetical protein